jgi:dTMP kinase
VRPFIVFEGIDGTGKGTQMERAAQYLSLKVGSGNLVKSKDPGGTPLGAAIRRILYTEVTTHHMAPGVVDLLFMASHLQNWLTVVKPALMENKCVISDRWWHSQFAYMTQREVPEAIKKAYYSVKGAPPDLLILLAGDPETMVSRARSREEETHQSAKAWNDIEVLNKVQSVYLDMAKNAQSHRVVWIDDKSPNAVWDEVREHLADCIERCSKFDRGMIL